MKKAERLNQELIFLRDKHSFQLKDLMMEFTISKRTALRDVVELGNLGLPFYVENGRNGGYQLVNQKLLVPIYFNQSEIQAIFFALDALTLFNNGLFEQSYPAIRQKLLATLPQDQQDYVLRFLEVVHYNQIPTISDVRALNLILQAILEEKVMSLTYTQYKQEEIQVQIYELLYEEGIWFCNAYDVDRKRWGTYRCDGMRDNRFSEDQSKSRSLKELADLKLDYEKHYHNIPFRCRLTASGKERFLKRHYPNMKLEMIEGIPYVTGGYNQEELSYMTHYLVSFGKELVIEFPKSLKKSYQKELREMMENNQ